MKDTFFSESAGDKKLSNQFNIPLLAQVPMNENVCRNCDEGHIDELFKDHNIKSAFDDVIKNLITGENWHKFK
jgi:ATP-binding protein involved in chromosome partitioning